MGASERFSLAYEHVDQCNAGHVHNMDLKRELANAVLGFPAHSKASLDEITHRLAVVETPKGYLFGRVRFAPQAVPSESLTLPPSLPIMPLLFELVQLM